MQGFFRAQITGGPLRRSRPRSGGDRPAMTAMGAVPAPAMVAGVTPAAVRRFGVIDPVMTNAAVRLIERVGRRPPQSVPE
ncbi:hypothetical protein [Actinomadura bangladeshensis]|uniref:Uncharacterized protein n=1 Tax=Actinomadura bangladeshensis TaxID=453573 RepID=A0A4R4P6R5_9ACTN|nr:hypothetical protein [Actinomadura bangladeshensis]TDC15832.1 hypothetical protein E1284_14360 [Actinomadura bangladeshensis]